MQLKDTVIGMSSNDYKERFKAEYWQLKLRCDRLEDFCNRIEAAEYSDFVPEPQHECPLHLLKEQLTDMKGYLHILEIRAVIEGINITDKL